MSSMSDIFRVIQHTVPSHRQNDALVLSFKQYIPLDNPNPRSDDVTIIGAPGNGHVKELYEPLWEELYHRSKTAGFRIRGIWIADGTHQGKSGILNKSRLQNNLDWLDHSHDLLRLIEIKHADMPGPIFGIGHSMGGTQLCVFAYLSRLQPHILYSLILIEPGIDELSPTSVVQQGIARCAQLSLSSPDTWPSIQAAQEFTARNPLFQTWDARVVKRWLQYGLCDVSSTETETTLSSQQHNETSTTAVTLTTPRHQEMLAYKRPAEPASSDVSSPGNKPSPYYRPEPHRVFAHLPHLRPSTLYLIGGKSPLRSPHLRELRLCYTGTGVGGSGGAVCGRVRETHVPGCGHSLGLEAVVECADESASWLGSELERWGRESHDRGKGNEGKEAGSQYSHGVENKGIRSRL
ncbi:Alpha/beta hydrolase family-domain-containing protein [Aspergillus candidus]|uniref:Alpha/beta hydrolase family-domain-containing protein n=1 Tax=Aspergillus candidus TaxID=41067 RepID=A0A2I2FL74_ASPCN|nr:Alpha/beta hydrolase family-domain-containing protein [Aspergillus candidus]PLB41372.1 Alpha/beta hydrolase family-domain-containing protein [Aspergillus candidus]